MIKQDRGIPFYATMTAGTTPVIATKTGASSKTIYITDISGSSDLAGSTISVKDGNTVIWKDIVGAGNYTMNFSTPLSATVGNTVTVTVTATAAGNANLSGFILNNS